MHAGPTNQQPKSARQFFGEAFRRPRLAHTLAQITHRRAGQAGRANFLASIQTAAKIRGLANYLAGRALA